MSYAYDNEEFSRYYDTFVAHLSDDIYGVSTVLNVYNEIIQQKFVDGQPTTVVELGCGTAENLISFQNHFRKRKDIKYLGIDHSQAMLDRAKEKLNQQADNRIECVRGNLTNFGECLDSNAVDCIFLPSGTFHHLITDDEQHAFMSNLRRTLRPQTGLFAIDLLPDGLVRAEPTVSDHDHEKFKLIAAEDIPASTNEWICKQTFEFDVPPKITLSWQLRTCSIPRLIEWFRSNDFEVCFYCVNGKDLLLYTEHVLSSLANNSTPVILVFRTRTNTN